MKSEWLLGCKSSQLSRVIMTYLSPDWGPCQDESPYSRSVIAASSLTTSSSQDSQSFVTKLNSVSGSLRSPGRFSLHLRLSACQISSN